MPTFAPVEVGVKSAVGAHETLSDNKPDWFLKISPEGKVPVFNWGDGQRATGSHHYQGPFINGENISKDLEITLDHFKSWKIPENLTSVHSYMKLLFTQESFVKTKPEREHVIAGWAPKVNP